MKKLVCIVLCISFTFLSNVFVYASQAINIPALEVKIDLNEDGSANITEVWSLKFSDNSSKFIRKISNSNLYSIHGFKVKGNGTEYQKIDEFNVFCPPQYFAYDCIDGEYQLEIYFQEDYDEKLIEISYVVENAVILHNDIAEFNWTIIDKTYNVFIHLFNAVVTIPKGILENEVQAWTHGDKDLSLEKTDLSINFGAEDVLSKSYIDIRVITGFDQFEECENYSNENAFEEIIRQEKQFAEKMKLQRLFDIIIDIFLFGLLPLLFFGFLFRIILKRAQNHHSLSELFAKIFKNEYKNVELYMDLPSKITPIELCCTLSEDYLKHKPLQFVAELFYLAQKEVINLSYSDKNRNEIIITWKENNLDEYENAIIDFFRLAANGAKHITTVQFVEYLKHNYDSLKDKIKRLNSELKHKLDNSGLIDNPAMRKMEIAENVCIITLVCSIIGFIFLMCMDLYLFSFVEVIAFLVACFLKRRLSRVKWYSEEGAEEARRWEGFREYLKKYYIREDNTLNEINKLKFFFPYAIILKETNFFTDKSAEKGNGKADKGDFIFEIYKNCTLMTQLSKIDTCFDKMSSYDEVMLSK